MTLTRAHTAFECGDFNEAAKLCLAVLDRDPTSAAAVLLLAQTMLAGGSFMQAITVAAAPTLDAKIGAKAGRYRAQLEDVLVDALVAWAATLENAKATKRERAPFVEATTFYAEHFDRYVVEVIGLEQAIVNRVAVGDTFRDVIANKRTKPEKPARRPAAKPAKPPKPAKPARVSRKRTASPRPSRRSRSTSGS